MLNFLPFLFYSVIVGILLLYLLLVSLCCERLQIVVATPGRLLDHIESKSGISVRLMGLQMLILDEADHLLDLGFRKDIEKIIDCLPRKRQSLLFSATVPREVWIFSLFHTHFLMLRGKFDEACQFIMLFCNFRFVEYHKLF